MDSTFIDTPAALTTFLNDLPNCKGQPPSLYLDLEGNNLSRHGTLSLMTFLVQPRERVYRVNVTTLKGQAFTTEANNGTTLKNILEDEEISKVFFDIRNDSSALFWLYGVGVQGIEDIQLYEYASRNFQRRCVNGLAKCIVNDSGLGGTERRQWQEVKDVGRRLFAPELGGSYAVFDARPPSPALEAYCKQDVLHMPRLREKYLTKLCDAWWLKIAEETKDRVRQSQRTSFNGKGRHMAMGPRGWDDGWFAMHERGKRTLFESQPFRIPAIETSASVSRVSLTKLDDDIRKTEKLLSFEDEENLSSFRISHDGDESDGYRDLTACDKECGYCGQCPY